MSTGSIWEHRSAYREASKLAVDDDRAAQAWRRAARWRARLESPECTPEDRQKFEFWRRQHALNAAAYDSAAARNR